MCSRATASCRPPHRPKPAPEASSSKPVRRAPVTGATARSLLIKSRSVKATTRTFEVNPCSCYSAAHSWTRTASTPTCARTARVSAGYIRPNFAPARGPAEWIARLARSSLRARSRARPATDALRQQGAHARSASSALALPQVFRCRVCPRDARRRRNLGSRYSEPVARSPRPSVRCPRRLGGSRSVNRIWPATEQRYTSPLRERHPGRRRPRTRTTPDRRPLPCLPVLRYRV